MFYKNARIFCGDFSFHNGAFEVVEGRFGRVLPAEVPEERQSFPALLMFTATEIPARIFLTAIIRG